MRLKLGLLRLSRCGTGEAPGIGRLAWAKYAAAAVMIHAWVLSFPMYQKSAPLVEREKIIDVMLVREEPELVPAPRRTKTLPLPAQPAKPKSPLVRDQPAGLQQAPKPAEKKQEPEPAGPGSGPDKSSVASPGGISQANDEEPGAVGAGAGRGKAGQGSSGTGSGGKGGGNGTGTGAGGGGSSGGIGGDGYGRVDTPLRFLHRVNPEYPPAAKKRQKEGTVDVVVTIDEKGTLIKVEVINATSQIFVQAVMDALRQSTYLPSQKRGLRRGTYTARFTLE